MAPRKKAAAKEIPREPVHLCLIEACDALIPVRKSLCDLHWQQVPEDIQDRLKKAYLRGQTLKRQPRRQYNDAITAAIEQVERNP